MSIYDPFIPTAPALKECIQPCITQMPVQWALGWVTLHFPCSENTVFIITVQHYIY